MKPLNIKLIIIVAIIIILAIFGSRFYLVVDAGHVAVASLFGKVQTTPYTEGLHIPVNPFYDWNVYDIRQKTHLEQVKVPSQDQLQTSLEVSVQFRIMAKMTPTILKETGLTIDAITVHLVPKLRSLLREQGKSIVKAEDFFLEDTQQTLQSNLLEGLRTYLEPKGIEIQAVLIRSITLPPFIMKAIESKKEREQEVVKQKAELERFRTEQEQKIAQAEAERKAAEQKAKQIRVMADAKAYEIERINKAIANNANYIKLQSLEALKAISKDNSSKIYFINGDSPNPLPLMHLGDK